MPSIKSRVARADKSGQLDARIQELEQVLDQIGEAVIVKDLNAVVTSWNREAARLYGFSAHEAIGQSLRQLHAADLSDADYACVLERIRAGVATESSTTRRKKTGELIHVALKTTPLRGAQGNLIGEITVARDVTVLHEMEEDLREAQSTLQVRVLEMRVESRTAQLTRTVDDAKRANASKSEFLARMSHEIRTPMNGVLGMLDILKTSGLNSVQSHYVQAAHVSALALLHIVDDILDFSKIEAGKLVVEAVDFDLHALLDHIKQLWSPEAARKNLALEISIPADVPKQMNGDPTRLMQVMINLVSNALKFTSHGSVRVSVGTVPVGGAPKMLRFAVEDTGLGLSPETRSKLFSVFTQADESVSRRFGGTGLGLAICRQLVKLMGGEIGVTSEPGVGSRFSFTVPFVPASAPAMVTVATRIITPAARPIYNARVLVADDNEINREVAEAMLKAWGCTVSFAVDGREAVEAVRQDRPDLVLMDCHMPVVDGFQATIAIRAWERDQAAGARVPIVAVSASAMSEDRERCAAVGMCDFLAKPLNTAAVGEALQRILSGGSARSQAGAQRALQRASLPDPSFDREQFEEMRLVASGDFAQLIARFRAGVHEQLLSIRAALQRDDAAALKKCAHRLKGTAATLGARALASSCTRLEERARAGELALAAEEVEQLGAQCVAASAMVTAALNEKPGPVTSYG